MAASDSTLVKRPGYDRMDALCKLRLPRVGIRYTETERHAWGEALGRLPNAEVRDSTRLRGEKWLLARVDLLGQLSIGGRPLQFGQGKSELSTAQQDEIRRIAAGFLERLNQNPQERLFVTGYADNNRGGMALNEALASKRAEAVVRALEANQVKREHIHVSTDVVPVPEKGGERPEARAVALNLPASANSLAAPEVRQARAGGVDVSTVLVGTTEFLLAEAQEQVEQYLLRSGATRLCATTQWRIALPVTCALVPVTLKESVRAADASVGRIEQELLRASEDSVRADERLRTANGARDRNPGASAASAGVALPEQHLLSVMKRTRTYRDSLVLARAHRDSVREDRGNSRGREYFPGMEMLRNAISQDLRTLPYRVSGDALKDIARQGGTPEVRERAMVALYLLRYVDEIGRAGKPLHALRSAALHVQNSVELPDTQSVPILDHLRRAAEISDMVTTARADLRRYWDGDALADSASLYAVKALVLNLGESDFSRRFPAYEDGVSAHVGELLTIASTAQGLVTSIERSWTELRELPRDSATYQAARAALVSRIASDAIDLAVAVLPPDLSDSRSILQPVPPIRDLMLALAERNAPQALNSLVQLGHTVQQGGMLSGESMRVLAFGTDVVQARTTTEVQGAFQRLVSAGPGYQGKRASSGTFWRLNAYAGLAGGGESLVDADGVDRPSGWVGALTLPIGVEVGKPVGLNGSRSLFVQALDLGAIAAARINRADDMQTFPKFSFGSVVAPGAFLVQSFGDTPFVCMGGFTYVPQARQTDDGEEWGGFRATLGVAVDIPLFP